MSWRPEGWENPMYPEEVRSGWVHVGRDKVTAFEAGADAMLEKLKPYIRGLLPMLNGRGHCFYCDCGSELYPGNTHIDSEGDTQKCLMHDDYKQIRIILGLPDTTGGENAKPKDN